VSNFEEHPASTIFDEVSVVVGYPHSMPLTPATLEAYLHDRIPITSAMGVRVKRYDGDSITLTAPLGPNINHRDSVFGGSASTMGILSAWALLHARMREIEGTKARIVIQRNTMDYLKPITGDFESTCRIGSPAEWDRFLKAYFRKGAGRMVLESTLWSAGELVGRFDGTFVAFDMLREATPQVQRDRV
jgi:thioesterase domain-containing protein